MEWIALGIFLCVGVAVMVAVDWWIFPRAAVARARAGRPAHHDGATRVVPFPLRDRQEYGPLRGIASGVIVGKERRP